MRIGVHGDPAVHPVPGGVGVYVRRLIDELLAAPSEHRILPILSRFAEPPLSWMEAELIRSPMRFGPQYAAWNFAGRPRIGESLELVHATGLVVPPAPGARLVSTVHDLAVERLPEVVPIGWREIYQRGLKLAVAKSEIICAVSESTKQELVEDYGVDPDRIVVTPEAPNVTPGSPRNPDTRAQIGIEGRFILNVGTIEPRKNQVRLIHAFARAGDALSEYVLVLAGVPGWGQEEVEKAIDSLGIGHRVVLTGRVTNLDLASLYAEASVFAFPSVYEGFGIPLVEAMAFGVPCLAGSTPALTELAGGAAEMVDPKSTDGLAEALVRLATDDGLRGRLRREGPERAGTYTWARTARLTLEAYRRAAA